MYYRLVLCNMSKDEGNDLYKAGRFPEARAKYIKAAKMVLGDQFKFPVEPRRVKNEKYMQLVWQEMMDVVACFNNMAQCYIREGNFEQVSSFTAPVESCEGGGAWKLEERMNSIDLETNMVNWELQALEWLQEVAVIYMNQSFAQRTPLFCSPPRTPQTRYITRPQHNIHPFHVHTSSVL